jgi:hypothetical protein
MGQFGEQIAHVLIRFVHQIVDDQKDSQSPIETVDVRQSLVKFYVPKF